MTLSTTSSTIQRWPNATKSPPWPPSIVFPKRISRKPSPPAIPTVRWDRPLRTQTNSAASAYVRDVIRPNFIYDVHLSRLAKRIFIFSQVFFRQRIDMRVRALFGDFHHLALNR